MKKVVVIGGGASGLVAAIYAAKAKNQVTIIERNNNCGKKLLMTGNGKCNYWNVDQDLEHYHTQNPEILKQIITDFNQKEVLSFFDALGIIPKIKDGYYYPYSNQAVSVQYSLLLEAKLLGIKIINNTLVEKIELKKDQFIIETSKEQVIADKVILATGSKATPKTGSDGIGYQLAKQFGHTLIKPLPALVSLKGHEKYFKDWTGIRTDVNISLYNQDHFIKQENGEIQLTDYGLSGICVFNLSHEIAKMLDKKQSVKVIIDFLPWVETKKTKDFIKWIEKRNNLVVNRQINELFDGILNYKLVKILLDISKIDHKKYWNNLTDNEKNLFVRNIKEFSLELTATNSFDKAQVCSGGIPLSEIDPHTMESLKTKNLYLVGELLDVDGDCGGYNLGFAWMSSMLAGKAMEDK